MFPQPKKWSVTSYRTTRGELPVEQFTHALDANTYAKTLRMVELLERYGPQLRPPYSKKIKKDLYELRIKGKVEVRIIYTFLNGIFHLLHAFKKKGQKIPLREIKLAEFRLATLID